MLGLTRGQASAKKKVINTAFSRPGHQFMLMMILPPLQRTWSFFFERKGWCEGFPLESKRRELLRARIHPPAVHPRTPSNGAMMLLGIGTGIALPTLA